MTDRETVSRRKKESIRKNQKQQVGLKEKFWERQRERKCVVMVVMFVGEMEEELWNENFVCQLQANECEEGVGYR